MFIQITRTVQNNAICALFGKYCANCDKQNIRDRRSPGLIDGNLVIRIRSEVVGLTRDKSLEKQILANLIRQSDFEPDYDPELRW